MFCVRRNRNGIQYLNWLEMRWYLFQIGDHPEICVGVGFICSAQKKEKNMDMEINASDLVNPWCLLCTGVSDLVLAGRGA